MAAKYTVTEDFSPGFKAKRDATQLSAGALITSSQNVRITDGDRVGTRPGTALFGAASTATTPITSMHVFRKRDGTEIPMRSYGTVVEYRHPGTGAYENLITGLTSGQIFGYADHNINTQLIELVYFCNAVDPMQIWSGAYTQLNGALAGGESTITVDTVLQDTVYYTGTAASGSTTTAVISPGTWGTDLWNNFYVYVTSGADTGKISKITATTSTTITYDALGTGVGTGNTFEIRKVAYDASANMKLRIGTSTVTYTGFGSATTFTGCSGTPVAADNAAVTQLPEQSFIAPRGNILEVLNTRMLVSGVKKNPQSVYYSKLLDAADFTFSATRTAGQGGVIDTPEGGGAVKGLSTQEDTVYILKKDIVKTLTFTQDGNDLPVITTLLQAPNVGPNYVLAPFKIDNQVFYTTAEGAVKSASRVPNVTSVQALQISDSIVTYMRTLDVSTAAGIFYRQRAFISVKSSTSAASNDVVLVYNYQKNAWEAPIIGWNASCWMIYGDALYFGSSINPEVYKFDEDVYDDNGNPYESVARFAFSNYGDASLPKQFESVFMEGYITENTTITITVLYNYKGSQETRSTTLRGTDSQYIVASTDTTGLGLTGLGEEPMGSTADVPDDLQKFRIYLQTSKQPFYELSVEVSSNEVGSQWDILRFGPDVTLLATPVTSLRKQLA